MYNHLFYFEQFFKVCMIINYFLNNSTNNIRHILDKYIIL